MQTQTHGIHQGTYDAVFQHPIARNLQWRDVKSMLTSLSDETSEHADNLKFTRNGLTLVVHPPKQKDFSDVEELMRVRRFLEKSGTAAPAAVAEGVHLLVVIDHREARIFKTELHGATPQRIAAYEAQGAHRHLHNVDDASNGQRKPEPKAFYEAVAKALGGAEQILILGSATGASSAMDHLVAELKQHHAEVAKHVAGTVVVNEQHMSDDQLLAEARKFYAAKGS
jgi:hypothetical protein